MSVTPLQSGQSQGKVAPRTRMNTDDFAGREDTKSCAPSTSRAGAALLRIQDVAEHCRCSVWTVRDWIDGGKLEALRLPGRLVRISPAALERFLDACEGS